MKNYMPGIVFGIIAILSSLFIVGIPIGEHVIAIGFLPGMILSIIGIITTLKQKDNYKNKTSLSINITALVISMISMIISIINGFIIK